MVDWGLQGDLYTVGNRGKGVKSSHRERGSTVLGECSKTQIEQDTEYLRKGGR